MPVFMTVLVGNVGRVFGANCRLPGGYWYRTGIHCLETGRI